MNPAPAAVPGLDAVMPLARGSSTDGYDFDRADTLFASLRRHVDPGMFDQFTIVTPEADVDAARARFSGALDMPIRVVSELDVVPQMRRYAGLTGWTKQQLIKIAFAAQSDHPFTMTFDADAICINPFTRADLFRDGRAVLDIPHPSWQRAWYWPAAARILNTDPPQTAETIAITPVVLAGDVVRRMIARIEAHAPRGDWFARLADPLRPYAWQQLFPRFRERYRWSEYALYYLTAVAEGLFDSHHFRSDAIRLVSLDSLLAGETDIDRWQPQRLIAGEETAFFVVVQSKLKFAPSAVEARLRDWQYFI